MQHFNAFVVLTLQYLKFMRQLKSGISKIKVPFTF
jgi:hypothetical protein